MKRTWSEMTGSESEWMNEKRELLVIDAATMANTEKIFFFVCEFSKLTLHQISVCVC